MTLSSGWAIFLKRSTFCLPGLTLGKKGLHSGIGIHVVFSVHTRSSSSVSYTYIAHNVEILRAGVNFLRLSVIDIFPYMV